MLAGQCSLAMTAAAAPRAGGEIVLADSGAAAPVIIDADSEAFDGIKLNAEAFSGDIELLTGKKPTLHLYRAGNDSGDTSVKLRNYALSSAGGTITDTGIHEDGIKKKAAVNDGQLDYSSGYWRGLNNGTASLTVELNKAVSVQKIDVIGRTDDGTAAKEDSTSSAWANQKFTVSYKDTDGSFKAIKTIDKTAGSEPQTVWDKIELTNPVNTSAIKIEFQKDCGKQPAVAGQQASVYVTEVQVWGLDDGMSGSSGVTEGLPSSADTVIIAGTVKDSIILKLKTDGKLDTSKLEEIENGYEQYNIQVVDKPFAGIGKAVVIAGSDKRGTIYGLYHISQDLGGLSPWYYWGDVPVNSVGTLSFSQAALETTSRKPSVKYRGIFLNDEAPSLTTWVKKFGGYNQDFYDHVYELILRLKANYLWPAMWGNVFSEEGTEVVNGVKDTLANARHADAWGVVMGTSHHEPMARAGLEWQRIYKNYGTSNAWNFNINKEAIAKFWYDGAERNKDFENVITIGMRGESDSPLVHPDGTKFTLGEQIEVLQEAINSQKDSLDKLGLKDSPQMICLYKEVEEAWYGGAGATGLRTWDVLQNDIVMLCEDNNGNLRTLPTEEDKAFHKGGWGMYYHFDYVGGPRTYMWVNTTPLTKTWNNMTMAYDHGVQDMWIVNVGDLKPMELPISYFLDMAYDFDQWGTNNPNSSDDYVAQWVEQQFGHVDLTDEDKAGIAQILQDYPQMNTIRRPEAVLGDTFSAINYNELQQRLADAMDLEARAEKYRLLLEGSEYEDAYYQLVYYPAAASANVNKMQMFAGLNRLYYTRKSVAANAYAALVDECIQRDKDLQDYYNNTMSGGKWKGMMLSPHVGYTAWNSESGAYPTGLYVTPLDKAVMLVDVDGSQDCLQEGTLTLPEFTSTGMECHALTISNGGGERLDYTIDTSADWIKVSKGEGSVNSARTLPVSVDWEKLTASAEGTITITSSSGKTVTVTVKAAVLSVDGLADKTFTAADGVIVIDAADFVENKADGGGQWKELEALGKTRSSMKVFPTTKFYNAGSGPMLRYRVQVPEDGEYTLTVYVGPSNNVYADKGVQYAVSVDGGSVKAVNTVTEKFTAGDGNEWSSSILKAGRTAESKHTLTKGIHTIEIYGMDAGLLLEKLVLSKEPLKASHMGPKATWYKGKTSSQQSMIHYQLAESMTIPGTIFAADAAAEDGDGVEKEEGMLKAVKGKTYVYPVTIGGSGSYQFDLTGSSSTGATAVLKYGSKEIGRFALSAQKQTVSADDPAELTQGTGELTLEVTGDALIDTIFAEKLNLEPGLKVAIFASSAAEGSSAEYAYDQKKSSSWKPESSDLQEPYIGLDFEKTVYTDWFRLSGKLESAESYEVQMSDDGSTWTTIYEETGAPESGKKIYIQGMSAHSGKQWRVLFHGVSSTFNVSEMELNTYVNWALEDKKTTVTVPYEGDSNSTRYKDTSLIDGDRITSPETGAWVAGDVGKTGNKTATLEFGEARTISGVYLTALQESVYSNDGKYYWTGNEGEIPDDTMTTSYVQNSYKVFWRNGSGEWVEAMTMNTNESANKKVLTECMFDKEITTDAIKVEVGSYYWIMMAEIEPVQIKRYTLNGVKEGDKNWALAVNGGVIEVKSGTQASPDDSGNIKKLNDGVRISDNGNGTRWRGQHFPTEITVSLSEQVALSEVNIIGQQDADAGTGVEPDLNTECGRYEVVPVTIEYWDKASGSWKEGTKLTAKGKAIGQWKPSEEIVTDKVRLIYEEGTGGSSGAYIRLVEIEVCGIARGSSGEESKTGYQLEVQNGLITSVGGKTIGKPVGQAEYQESVEVEADKPGKEQKFGHWELLLGPEGFSIASSSNAASMKFDMPKGNVKLRAVFEDTDKATRSNASAEFRSEPAGWSYAEQEELDSLLEDAAIITSADNDVLDKGGKIKVTMKAQRKDSSTGVTAKGVVEAYGDNEMQQTAFLFENSLTKTTTPASGKEKTEALTDAQNKVRMVFGIPDKWKGLDGEDYTIVSYEKDEDGNITADAVGYEWKEENLVELEAGVNGSYAVIVPIFYQVIFKNYDGTVLKECKVKAGKAAVAPDKIPEREGYVFTGWNKDFSKVTQNLTVTAKFTKLTNEEKVISSLQEILDRLLEIDANPFETYDEVMRYLKQVNAIDFSSYVESEEILDILKEIEEAAAELIGVDLPEVELNSRKVTDAEVRGGLFGLMGEDGYLRVRDTSVPGRIPVSDIKLENAFALEVKLCLANGKVVPVKGLLEFSFELPDNLKVDDSLIVIHYRDGDKRGEVIPYQVNRRRMTIVTSSLSTFTIANTVEEDETYRPGSGGSSKGSKGGSSGKSAGIKPSDGVWKSDEKGWWYEYPDGTYPVNTWKQINNGSIYNWYYFDAVGYMKTGWFTDTDGLIYYLEEAKDGSEGMMITGWKFIGGKWYYFNPVSDGKKGSLFINRGTPDGHRVDKEGVWINP